MLAGRAADYCSPGRQQSTPSGILNLAKKRVKTRGQKYGVWNKDRISSKRLVRILDVLPGPSTAHAAINESLGKYLLG